MKTPNVRQAAVGSELAEESQRYTEMDVALTRNSTEMLQSMASLNLLTWRPQRRRKVNIPGAKAHRQSLLMPPSCFSFYWSYQC